MLQAEGLNTNATLLKGTSNTAEVPLFVIEDMLYCSHRQGRQALWICSPLSSRNIQASPRSPNSYSLSKYNPDLLPDWEFDERKR
jgi:hypothetical protein